MENRSKRIWGRSSDRPAGRTPVGCSPSAHRTVRPVVASRTKSRSQNLISKKVSSRVSSTLRLAVEALLRGPSDPKSNLPVPPPFPPPVRRSFSEGGFPPAKNPGIYIDSPCRSFTKAGPRAGTIKEIRVDLCNSCQRKPLNSNYLREVPTYANRCAWGPVTGNSKFFTACGFSPRPVQPTTTHKTYVQLFL
jgi:hypothetical protein